MDKEFHSTLYWVSDYLSTLGFKLVYVNKRGPGQLHLIQTVTNCFQPIYYLTWVSSEYDKYKKNIGGVFLNKTWSNLNVI